jgi:hypothetical protein
MPRYRFRHALIAVLLFVALLSQGTWALASTTGGLNGTVVASASGAAIANAKVTASSPSQTVSTQTDPAGRFTFVSLAPDTYTVSVEKDGFQAVSTAGVTVFADSNQAVSLRMDPALTTIAKVTSTAAGGLVKGGTTADVYAINAATQDKLSGLGGGGGLNSAYSAIASVPGAFVPLNQTGYYQTVHIRGGDYDQVGYEFDGVPVNRSFDNYPSSSASSLGNAEVQVYTGATPANAEGQGLSGYINQVIRTGTYPGFGTGELGLGTPLFYHKATIEVGGANPSRTFSYYFGIGGYNQEFTYVDNSNASSYINLSSPLFPLNPSDGACGVAPDSQNFSNCYAANGGNGFPFGPGGYALAPYPYGSLASIASRDAIVNFHFALPHKNDGGRDDVQLMWDSSNLHNILYSSINDAGGAGVFNDPNNAYGGLGCTTGSGASAGCFVDSFAWSGPIGVLLPANPSQYVQHYLYPSSTGQRAAGSVLDPNQRDTNWNNQEIVKAQYQKNFGTNAFLRVYGYTYYSDWLQNGPNCSYQSLAYFGAVCGASPDYELSSHTRGASAQFESQINPQNLFSVQASYVTATSTRDNNTQMFNGGGSRARDFVAVDSTNPLDGICYTVPISLLTNAASGPGVATSCNPNTPTATFGSWRTAMTPHSFVAGLPDLTTGTCGAGPCQFLVAENSQWATFNTVKPVFTSFSLNDEFRPNDKFLLNLGVRLDSFQFTGSSTLAGPARDFWFKAYNQATCVNTVTGVPIDKTQLALYVAGSATVGVAGACANFNLGGNTYATANLVNNSGVKQQFNIFQPRLSGTYTFNPDTVLRFSAGRYVEAPNTAFEQYNTLEEDLPFAILGPNLYQYGRNQPSYAVRPPTSDNFDLSLEHHVKGSDLSFKLTPFLRKTKDQIQNFFLNQQTGFVSGLNVGRQTSRGFELQVQKGDFSKDGFSGLLSFAYTDSYINYDKLTNGTTIISPINAAIGGYNAFTKNCAAGGSAVGQIQGGQYVCGQAGPTSAGACYDPILHTSGACAPGQVENPYWNAPVASLINPTQNFPTYDIFPGGIGSSADAFGSPYVTALVLNYKHDKLSVTPSFQLISGAKYGAPETTPGVDPSTCTALPVPGADPRNPNAATGGNPYDALSCTGSLLIPNQYTGVFDNLGAFKQPNQLIGNLQVTYDASKRVTLVGTFANIINRCWGGTKAAWTLDNSNVCSYGILPTGGLVYPVGNFYNPGSTIQQPYKYPYMGALGGVNVDGTSTKTPFNFYVEARIKF